MKTESNILRKLNEIEALLNTKELENTKAKLIIKALKEATEYNDSYSDALSYLKGVLTGLKDSQKYFNEV